MNGGEPQKAIPLLLLLLAAGCQPKLDENLTIEVRAAKPNVQVIPAIKSSQKVNISAKTNGGQIDVYFFLEKNQDAVEKNLLSAGPKLLASKLKVTEAELSETVPANEAAVVRIESTDGKKVEVQLRIFN